VFRGYVQMTKLLYCEERGDYYLDNWLAVAIIANKALLQQKEGKKFRMAILTGTRVSEVQIGTIFKLGNAEYRASTKGWVEE
jgi:hypothetical protein